MRRFLIRQPVVDLLAGADDFAPSLLCAHAAPIDVPSNADVSNKTVA